MGILTGGILGPMKNKTGTVIGRIHRGQNVVTQLYKRRKRRKKKSKEELASQARLGLLSSFLSEIHDLVEIGFKKMVKHNSPVNAAFTYNYDRAFIEIGEVLVLNYPELIYSLGDVEGPESPALEYLNGFLNISWYDGPQSKYCQYSDQATVLVYEPAGHDLTIFSKECKRSDLQVSLAIDEFIGKEVHAYICFASADGKYQGKSVYLGLVVLRT